MEKKSSHSACPHADSVSVAFPLHPVPTKKVPQPPPENHETFISNGYHPHITPAAGNLAFIKILPFYRTGNHTLDNLFAESKIQNNDRRHGDQHLSLTREGTLLTVKADAYAKHVMIEGIDGDVKLSDSFFDMEAGTRRVEILEGDPGSFRLRSVYDIA